LKTLDLNLLANKTHKNLLKGRSQKRTIEKEKAMENLKKKIMEQLCRKELRRVNGGNVRMNSMNWINRPMLGEM